MERLTTNKPVDEMSMLELAYNSCYAKDGKARYRDYDTDMDGRDYARNLMVTLTGEELPLDDESFDEEIQDNLQYDQFSDIKGLIALFYRNLWAMADLRERLKAYEDKEEQGLLISLPCRVGASLYQIGEGFYQIGSNITEYTVTAFTMSSKGGQICVKNGDLGFVVNSESIGERFFRTRSEAESALARMKGE